MDLSDLSGKIPASDVVRRAAKNVSPLSLSRPAAWMIREALAKAHGFAEEQIVPRTSLTGMMNTIMGALVGPEDRVALAGPCRPEFTHHVLRAGARYVDVGRDHEWGLQLEAFERLMTDGGPRAVILGRPNVPTGTVAPLEVVKRGLQAGVIVIVDETALAYVSPSDGLPRSLNPKSNTALALFSDSDVPTDGLLVLRSVPGLGMAELIYTVASPETAAHLWRVDPIAQLPAPVAAGAWIALDHTSYARRLIVERCTLRSNLRTAIQALGP